MRQGRALVIVDVQNDFCEGGSLAVAGGNKVAEKIALYEREHGDLYEVTVLTADDHLAPPNDNGGHFALPPAEPDYVDTWPVHCVQGTKGNEFHPEIKHLADRYPVFSKGQGRPDYSGFQGTSGVHITLDSYLMEHGITEIDVVGIAGDHCVKATALDGVWNGYYVTILPDMVASVGGVDATIRAMQEVALTYISKTAQEFGYDD